MAWIEAHQELARHPKVRKAARSLDVSKAELIGRLFMLWWWALDYAPDGHIHDLDDLTDALELDDRDEPATFIDCLIDHGFIDPDRDLGGYRIHDWDDYAGKWAQTRADRKADGRKGAHYRWHVGEGKTDPTCPLCSPPNSPPNSPPIGRGNAYRTGQDRTEQQPRARTRTNVDNSDIPTDLLQQAAEAHLAELEADGYQVKSRKALIAKLMRSEDIRHRARQLQPTQPLPDHITHGILADIDDL